MFEHFNECRDAGDAVLNGKPICISDQIHLIADKPVQPNDTPLSVLQDVAILPSPSTDIEPQAGWNSQRASLREEFGKLTAGIIPASPGDTILHALETTLDS
jgi:hypothetical protein